MKIQHLPEQHLWYTLIFFEVINSFIIAVNSTVNKYETATYIQASNLYQYKNMKRKYWIAMLVSLPINNALRNISFQNMALSSNSHVAISEVHKEKRQKQHKEVEIAVIFSKRNT